MSHPFQDSEMPTNHNLLAGLGLDEQKHRRIWQSTREKIFELGYDLGSEALGTGASAIVYPAQHRTSGNKVAIKIILDPSNERALQQFIREQRVLASEYIPSEIVPKFVHSLDADGIQPLLIMERIEGMGILEYAKEHRLSIEQRINLIERMFEAYRQLHDCNLVHGDPSHKNVFIVPGNRVRLLDFGNSRRAAPGYNSIHSISGGSGTPTFAPDSQLLGLEPASIQTDIQSVSAIAFTLLTGKEKQASSISAAEKMHRQCMLDDGVPSNVIDILARGMRSRDTTQDDVRDPSLFGSCKDIIDAFEIGRSRKAIALARRRQAILAIALLIPLILAFYWGYGQFLEVQRTQQQQAISLLQNDIAQISRRSHPAVVQGLKIYKGYLDAYHQAEQGRDTSKIQSARLELINSMRSVLELDRRLERVIPLREALGIVLQKMPWVESAPSIAKSKYELANRYLRVGESIDSGETDDVDADLTSIQTDLAELASRNITANSALQSRLQFDSERDSLADRVVKLQGFAPVTAISDSAESAWQSGDFQQASSLFGQARQKLTQVLPSLESEDETKERIDKQTSRIKEEVTKLRIQIAQITQERDEKTAKTNELQSQIATITKHSAEDRDALSSHRSQLTATQEENEKIRAELNSVKETVNGQTPLVAAYWKLKPEYEKAEGERLSLVSKLELLQSKVARLERAGSKSKVDDDLFGSGDDSAKASGKSKVDDDLFGSGADPFGSVDDPFGSGDDSVKASGESKVDDDLFGSGDDSGKASGADPFGSVDDAFGTERILGGREASLAKPDLQPGDAAEFTIAGIPARFRYCPPCKQGEFKMGSPTYEEERSIDEAQVDVWFDKGFFMMETEATNELWNAVMGDNKGDQTTLEMPVVDVSYHAVVDFVDRGNKALAKKSGPSGSYKLILPTEAQWEYACRAGSIHSYCFGDRYKLGEYAWYTANSIGKLHPVGSKKQNRWNLFDMHGSVWEWTADWYCSKLAGGLNPIGPNSGTNRVRRGGSSWTDSSDCRSADRNDYSPDYHWVSIGFRPALQFSPK